MTEFNERFEPVRSSSLGDEFYRTLIDASPLSILVAQDRRYLYANPAAVCLLGFSSSDDLRGVRTADLIAPEDHDLARERLKNILAGRSNPSVDMTLIRADGSRQKVESIAVPITLDGQPAALVVCQDVAKRSLLKKALQESRFKYRTLVEQLPAVTYTASIDAASTTLFVSPQVERMIGYTQDEYQADSDIWRRRLHPGDRDRVLDEVHQAHVSGAVFQSEYRMIHRDGRVVWFRDEATVVRDDEGEAISLQGVMFDITDYKQALDDICSRDAVLEARNHTVARFLTSCEWSTAVDEILARLGVAADVSRTYVFENFTGPDNELWTRQSHEWVASGIEAQADNPALKGIPWAGAGMDRWADLMKRGEIVQGLVRDFPGSERAILEPQEILSILAIPVYVRDEWWGFVGFDECRRERSWGALETDALQAAVHLLGLAIEQQRAGEALRESKERQAFETRTLRTLNRGGCRADVIREILEMIRTHTGVDAVGLRVEEGQDFPYYSVSGFPPDFVKAERYLCARDEEGEVVRDGGGAPVLECMCGTVIAGRIDGTEPVFTEGGSFWTNSFTDLLATAPPEVLELVTRGRCHKLGYESMALVPLRSDDRTIGLLQLNDRRRDIFTLDMVEFLERLCHSIGLALSRKLAEDERQRVFDESRRLEHWLRQSQKMEAIGVLAGGIAHDFNNILHGIMGYTQFVLDTLPGGDRNADYLKAVLAGGEQAADLIKQIRTFSCQAEQERRPTDLRLVARETLKILRGSLPSTISVRENLDTQCEKVLADPVRIKQVIMNLGTNAFNAMRENGGELEVALDQVRFDDRSATGFEGIEPGPHVRLLVRDTGCGMDPETSDRIFEPYFTTGEMTGGTGLGLAVVHGIVKSHDAAITVESRLGEGTAVKIFFPVCAASEAVSKKDAPIETEVRGTERILFVDDEETHVRLGRIGLGNLGYAVTGCTSPAEALGLFEKEAESYDLVVADLIMPRMTGLQLAEKMHSLQPRVPILLCTGRSEQISEEQMREAGIARCILKPATYPEMARAIRESLDKK